MTRYKKLTIVTDVAATYFRITLHTLPEQLVTQEIGVCDFISEVFVLTTFLGASILQPVCFVTMPAPRDNLSDAGRSSGDATAGESLAVSSTDTAKEEMYERINDLAARNLSTTTGELPPHGKTYEQINWQEFMKHRGKSLSS